MESEFIALASAGKEAEWLRNMLYDIELWPQPMSVISIVYVKSSSNLADSFAKGLSRDLVRVTFIGMGLKPF